MSLQQDPFAAPLRMQLFGGAKLFIDGAPPPASAPKKVYALLGRLALAPDRKMLRSAIAADLWPDAPNDDLRHFYLRRTLTEARELLGTYRDLLSHYAHGSIQLNVDADVDVVTFDQAIASQDPERIEEAIQLYNGPLLVGYREPWITYERDRRQAAYLRGIDLVMRDAASQGKIERVVELCNLAVGVDPLIEESQRGLISALADAGDVPGAERAYRRFVRLLKKLTGAGPEPETVYLFRQISRGKRYAQIAVTEAAPRITPGDFPRPINPILGREPETEKVCALVRANRLVTLMAAGGFGKTRLALHVASLLDGEFSGGIWFVDLAPLSDPRLILTAIMEQLRLEERGGVHALQTLANHLKPMRTLIILDNCEHLCDECAATALSLLSASPRLHILTTSRHSLGVTGENLVRLTPLPTPRLETQDENADPKEWQRRYPAVSLFVQRAISYGAFELTHGSMAAISRICARLEGIALAIELAASQTRIYSVEDLDVQLEDLFSTLVTDNTSVMPRQRTLTALIDWSFNLLRPEETTLLERLSIFRGSWQLDTAAAVCGGDGLDAAMIKSHVSRLADKSMLQTIVGETSSMRFRLLETVRLYCHDRLKLAKHGSDLETMSSRHLEFFRGFADSHAKRINAGEQSEALRELDIEHENLRAALDYCIQNAKRDTALDLVISLWRYWMLRGHYSEGLSWFARAFDLIKSGDGISVAPAYIYAGNLAYTAGRTDMARTYFNLYLKLPEVAAVPVLTAVANASLALVVASERDFKRALRILVRSSAVFRSHNRLDLYAGVQSNMALCWMGLGESDRAIELYQEALNFSRQRVGAYEYVHHMVCYAGALAASGRLDETVEALIEATPQAFALGSVNEIEIAFKAYMRLGIQRQFYTGAACLLGIRSAFAARHHLGTSEDDRAVYELTHSEARAALASEFDANYDRGYHMPPADIESYLTSTFLY